MRIHLLRHAPPPREFAGTYLGSTNPSLDDQGRDAIKTWLSKTPSIAPVKLVASPLTRARQTAEAIAAAWNLAGVGIVDGWREIDFGLWDGLAFADIERRYPGDVARYLADPGDFSFPGGEERTAFQSRVADAFSEACPPAAGDLLAVTHGGVIAAILCLALGLPPDRRWAFRVGYLTLVTLVRVGDCWVMERLLPGPQSAF